MPTNEDIEASVMDVSPESYFASGVEPEEPEEQVAPPPHEAHPGTDETKSDNEAPPPFDPQFQEPLQGLLYIGRLTKDFHWLGHHFVLQTLSTDSMIEVGLVCKRYTNTVGEMKAYQAAVCAACTVSVDGKPLPMPITNDPEDTLLLTRFRYVLKWFPPVIDVVYGEYMKLEAEVADVIKKMGKASG